MNKQIYEFDAFLLDLEQKRLMRNGQPVSLQPKVFDLLVFFVERHGELVSRDELMQAVWTDTFVEETNLRFCIHALRKALGKNAEGKDYVETIPKRGYRFTAETSEKSAEIIPETIAETPPKIVEKPLAFKRNWLIGIAVFSLICLLIFAFAWQRNNVQTPKNALGFNQLAVLPFETVGEKEQAMQIGLTDSMITNLSKIKSLKILPIASVRQFAGQNFDALTVGKELQADAVLSGNYRFDGENVSVTANLLRVSNGATIWTETFTAKGKSDFEIENSIALRTARLLSLKIAEAEDEQNLANQKLNAEAVQSYLTARKIQRRHELFRRKEMIGLFEKAIALEPNWALAYAYYGEALLTADQLFIDWEKVERTANKAIELDNSLAQPHTTLGEIYETRDWNWEKAESEYKQAAALNPNYALSYRKYSRILQTGRRFAEAEAQLNKAVEIEPFSPVYHSSFCELYAFDRKFDKALAACNYVKQIDPDFWRTPKLLYWIYVERKMYAELGEMILGKLSPTKRAAHPLTKAFAENDLRSYWQSIIDEPSKSGTTYDRPTANAMFYLQIGEKEKALEYLEIALEHHDDNLPTVNADSTFDAIRNEKRFVEIMRKIGLQK